jgi:branched-chain amino acid transport system substrate-binding protein
VTAIATRGIIITTLVLCSCTGAVGGSGQLVGTIKIAADLPLTGDDAGDGIPVRDAIELAMKQAGRVCGASSHQNVCVTLQAAIYDDVVEGIHDPAKGAKNVQLMVADDHVVGMIGPLYDSVARSQLPVANGVRLAMISPANTDECLTQEPADGHCHNLATRLRPRGLNNYFRVATTQLSEGAAAADLARKTLGKRRALVVRDPSAFGQAVATIFSTRFARDGGTVVKTVDVGAESSPPSFVVAVQEAKAASADLAYFGGSDLLAAAGLRRELGAQMPEVPMIGTDRLASNQFAKAAGASVRGSYYTIAGPYPPSLKAATNFIKSYRARYGRDANAVSLEAFDATNVLIAAIRRAIDGAGGRLPGRERVLDEVAKTRDFDGLAGRFAFDSRGDTSLRWITAFQWIAATDRAGRFTAQLNVN